MIKRFLEWIGLKEKLHSLQSYPHITEGDIWWCAFGENIGIEINGKNKPFSRPVFVHKKLSREGFMGIPLTSQPKSGSWFVPFDFKGKKIVANLAQARVLSVKRLYDKMGELDEEDITRIKAGFISLYK